MKKRREKENGEKQPKSKSSSINKKKNPNNNNKISSYISSIDNMINKIEKYNLKSTCFKIFTYFKNNKYNEIPIEKIFSKLTKEYDTNPNNFLTAKNIPYNSRKNFITNIYLSLKNYSFISINANNKKLLRLNYKNALDYLNNLYSRNQYKKSSSSDKYQTKKERKKTNNNYDLNKNDTDNNPNHNCKSLSQNNKLIGKKRKRDKLIEEEEESKEIETNVDLTDKETKSFKKEKKNKYKNDDTNSNNTDNNSSILFFQGEPLKKNLSSFTFYEYSETNKNSSSLYIYDSIANYDKLNQNKLFLYNNKEEEKAYDLLGKEIEPMFTKIYKINNILNDSQKKISEISQLLNSMDQNLNNYKNKKKKFIKNSNTLKICLKSLENQINYFKLFQNTESVPYKDDICKNHFAFVRKHLYLGKNIVDDNEIIVAELNTYDINFNYCKISIENEINDIIKKNDETFTTDIIQYIINPDLIKYFNNLNNKKSNNNNDSYNDFRNIYDDNVQLKKIFENYNYKFILYDTD